MIFTMGSKRLLQVQLHLFCAFIVVFVISHSQAQHGTRHTEVGNSESSYFFYQRPDYPRDCKDVHNECSSSNSSGVFLIKPDGYPEPIEVYCVNDVQSGGWTVIYRRVDGSVDFNRNWQEFKNGFGFLSTEFWIGNEKLSYLTNQAEYELRIDIELSNGTSLFATYSAFKISDEWSKFKVASVGYFFGNTDLDCPPNMIFGNCSCQPSCEDPTGLNHCNDDCFGNVETCVCASGFLKKDGECVLPSECGCFITDANKVLVAGETYVNEDCSERCTCENGILSCNSQLQCDSNAVCEIQDDVRGCYCNVGFEGDGETCTPNIYTDCFHAYRIGRRQNGVYTLLPTGWPRQPFNVSCDMTGGGWTIFQRRIDGETNFYRNWGEYQYGFGSVQDGKDFWLGNEQLYYLTNQKSYKLRVEIVDSGGTSRYSEYTTFEIGDSTTKYRLSVSGHSGNSGDSMYHSNGKGFSTHDEDNDACSYHDCAEGHRGGWWYTNTWCYACRRSYRDCAYFQTRSSCNNICTSTNLNGVYNGGNGQNINWNYNNYCNLRSAEMKIRPSSA